MAKLGLRHGVGGLTLHWHLIAPERLVRGMRKKAVGIVRVRAGAKLGSWSRNWIAEESRQPEVLRRNRNCLDPIEQVLRDGEPFRAACVSCETSKRLKLVVKLTLQRIRLPHGIFVGAFLKVNQAEKLHSLMIGRLDLVQPSLDSGSQVFDSGLRSNTDLYRDERVTHRKKIDDPSTAPPLAGT
jgi:hypothetical protein